MLVKMIIHENLSLLPDHKYYLQMQKTWHGRAYLTELLYLAKEADSSLNEPHNVSTWAFNMSALSHLLIFLSHQSIIHPL